jgi:hypothetical protein
MSASMMAIAVGIFTPPSIQVFMNSSHSLHHSNLEIRLEIPDGNGITNTLRIHQKHSNSAQLPSIPSKLLSTKLDANNHWLTILTNFSFTPSTRV